MHIICGKYYNSFTFFSDIQKYIASPVASAILHAFSKQLLQQIEGHLHHVPYIHRQPSTVGQGSESVFTSQ